MTTAPNKIEGEIFADTMDEIIKTLPTIAAIHSQSHTVLIHGMGGHPKSFYWNLRKNRAVELLWTGYSSNVWWTYLLSFIPGQSAVVKVLDRQQINGLFLDIGSQSMAGLYFVPNDKVIHITSEIEKRRADANIESILSKEENYFLLTVNFDMEYEVNSDRFYRSFVYGRNLDKEIRTVGVRTE
jgi:hypothetical protein